MDRIERGLRMLLEVESYNRPVSCSKCGGPLIFAGVGEYHCEKCKNVDYDDYGKVRLYIEQHHGAKANDIEKNTGVSQKSIRQMVHDNKLEIVGSPYTFWSRN